MALSKNIKKHRKKSGLTQKALADKSGLSFSMISKLESGEQLNPSVETLNKIAAALNITPEKLLYIPSSIEEQIDDYIEYKRGLGKTQNQPDTAGPGSISGCTKFTEDPYNDLNFRKKLQAINIIPKPHDDLEDDYLSYIRNRPEIKKLVSSLKDASKEEIEQIITLIEAFQR